jgi:hypothetical protein
MTGTAADVIRIARAEVGVHEGYAAGHWNNIQPYSPAVPGLQWSQGQAWCQTFQSWVAMRADTASIEPRTASCRTACDWFKQRKRFSEYPAVGAQVFYGPGGGTHVGRVYAYDAAYVYTIEGNTNATGSPEGDGVYLKKRLRRDSYVHGYGYPDFPGGIVSADPAWARPALPKVSLAAVRQARRIDVPAEDYHLTYRDGVLLVERALTAEGLLEERWADGSYGTKTVSAYSAWQRRLGYSGPDADGSPGRDSLTRLGARHGFTVVD